ncbi:MAG: GAF domain-containing protein [Acidobacteria bacterium]|nr:GAF domain-containing protein [Acidobacteriota bacterium]
MTLWRSRTVPAAIWGLLLAFAVLQASIWILTGGIPRGPAVLIQVIAAWTVMIILATLATMRLGVLSTRIAQAEHAHRVTLDEVEELQTRNAMLGIAARSVDVPLAFQALAGRISRLVPCDRVGLALLSDNGEEFQTFTARTDDEERRTRARPEVTFKTERSALGAVVRSCEPLIIEDTAERSPDLLDLNVIQTAGFTSVLIVPLVARGRAVGTLNVVSRRRNAFDQRHINVLVPIAELFAITYIAQQLQIALGRHRSLEAMLELTASTATEINSALQAIIGHCDLLERGYPDPGLQRDLATVVRQAQRIEGLLEKMRAVAQERLKVVSDGEIPASPEAYGGQGPAGT